MTFYTVGYEGLDIDDFVNFLAQNKIRCLVDLRKNPVSRKKGFSKNRLAENLSRRQIGYRHLGALGVPSAWRKQAKEKIITRAKMFRDYVRQILPAEKEALKELEELLKKEKRVALLCYEANADDCHRSFVAEEILRRHPDWHLRDLHPSPPRDQPLLRGLES